MFLPYSEKSARYHLAKARGSGEDSDMLPLLREVMEDQLASIPEDDIGHRE